VTSLRLVVPLAVETEGQAADRASLAMKLGLPVEQVPTARRDETDLEIEWTLVNEGGEDAEAQLAVIGANEYFAYDPQALVVDEDEDEPPPLMGGRPISVPAGTTVAGVFREDELAEAAQDLDGFSRAGVNPQLALITRWDSLDVTGGAGGALAEIPSEAVALLLELDVSVTTDQPLTLVAKLRVRDRSGRLRPTATDGLVAPSTNVYTPPVVP